MNEFVARNGLIALDSSSISGPLTLNGRLSSSNSADTTFSQGSRLVEILTTSNGQYSIRSTQAIKAEGYYFANSTGNIYAFNGDNLIHFNSSNNLGIGTTNPTAKLDVSGSLRVTGNSNFTSPITASAPTNGDNAILIKNISGGNVIQLRNNGTAVFGDSVSIPYLTGAGGVILSPTNIMFGTDFVTYPTAKLHVSSSTAASVFRIDTAGGPGTLFVSGSGNLGIGTTSPSTKLEVSGDNDANIVRLTSTSNLGTTLWAGVTSHDIQFNYTDASAPGIFSAIRIIGNSESGLPDGGTVKSDFTIWTGGYQIPLAERLRITAQGNVGIGIASPTARLHVSGTAIITQDLAIRGTYLTFGGSSTVTSIRSTGTLNREILQYIAGPFPGDTNLSDHTFGNGQGDVAITSGTRNMLAIARGFNPSSGTGVYNFLSITGTVSQSNATGISRGIHINPTITNAADYRAIEWTNNTGWGLYGNGSANNYLGGSLGIGTTLLTGVNFYISKNITGGAVAYGMVNESVIQSSVTSIGILFQTNASTQNTNFALSNLRHYSTLAATTFSNVTAGGSVTNQYGFFADNSLTGATNNYGFYGNIPASSSRWNLYMAGTANNYLAGNLGIGTTSPIYSLDVLSPTGTEPLTTNTDNYAARIKRTYTNTSGSVSSRRYNTFFETTYTGNQAYTNVTGLYNYINYQNTNANSVISGIVSYIEPVSTVSGSSLISFAAQVGTGGSITSVTGYNSNLLSLTAGTTTNARLFRAEALGSTNTVTNLYGFIAESTLTSATNNYGFYGNIAAATGRWNLYMNGTANNYLAGNLGLGVTSPLDRLHVDLVDNQYAYFGGNNTSAGVLRGIRFGYGQSGPFYWKSAIIQEQTGDAAARGKIHILNNNQFGSNNASLSDARITILPSGEVGINNQSPVFRLDVSGSFRASGSITATTGSDYFDISHDITQPAITGSQVYEVNITPTLRYTAPNQTQTALRVAATFSGSTALSSSQSNIIADFGSTSAGSQLVINDTTSGSIYMVNDVSGLPIIEANSNWDVFIYDYPTKVFQKSGSNITISGSFNTSGSITIGSGSGDLYMYGHKMFSIGQFQNNSTLSGSANISQSFVYDTTDFSEGVTLVSGSRLTVANAGYYNIQFSAQLQNTVNTTANLWIWFKRNGTNVPESATRVVLRKDEYHIAAWNFAYPANANDYFEIVWQSDSADTRILYEPASGNIPIIPSIITTVTQIR